MTDFASAAMLRVLAQGFRELGLQLPPGYAPGPHAHVRLDHKRALVGAALAQRGLASLPLLGRGLRRFGDDPTLQALAAGATPADLFERWMRLERYIHSRHRIAWAAPTNAQQGGQARLVHLGRRPGQTPLPAEDLVVLGVLAALLEQTGARAVRATAGGAAAWPEPDAAALERAADRGQTGHWLLQWLDGPALRPATAPPEGAAADDHWPALVRQVFDLLRDALLSPPSLRELAAAVGLPARSLQRHLAAAGWGRNALLAEARLRVATAWLLHSQLSVAEVGLLSGHADQAHFTRQFARHMGVTPARFRQEFGRPR